MQDEAAQDGQQIPPQEQTEPGEENIDTQPAPVDSALASSENISGYEAPTSDQDAAQGQEMQEKGGVSLFTQTISSRRNKPADYAETSKQNVEMNDVE